MKKLLPLLTVLLLAISVSAQTKLNGAGATFPYPIYSKWFNEYHNQHPDIEIHFLHLVSDSHKIV